MFFFLHHVIFFNLNIFFIFKMTRISINVLVLNLLLLRRLSHREFEKLGKKSNTIANNERKFDTLIRFS